MITLSEELRNRFKSLCWRLGGMIVVAVIGFVIDNETALQIPTWLIVVLGLVSGEITKFIANKRK